MRLPYPLQKILASVEALRDEITRCAVSRRDDSVRLSHSIDDLKDSITAHREANQERHEANPPITTTTTLRTDVPITVETKPKRGVIEKLWFAIKSPLEVVGILAVIAYTLVSWNLWQDQADATNAAARQAESSRRTLNETVKQFRFDQRAWLVALGSGKTNPEVMKMGEPFELTLDFKNTGKTPALNTRTVSQGGEGKINEPCPIKYQEPAKHVPVIGPNETFANGGAALISQRFFQAFIAEKELLCWYGRMDYEDVYHRKHWLRFCFQYRHLITGKGGLFPCPNYNDVDRDEQ